MNLGELAIGERARIAKVGGSGELHKRFVDMGLLPGVVVHLERVAPLGDPVWIRLRGYQLSLRKAEASLIEVDSDSIERGTT